MKYRPEDYARALAELLDKASGKKEENILGRFIVAIKKNGDWGLRRKIMQAAEGEIVKKQGGRIILAEFARESALPKFLKVDSKDRFKKVINPKLIAGLRVTIDGERTADFSFERKLNKLFKRHDA